VRAESVNYRLGLLDFSGFFRNFALGLLAFSGFFRNFATELLMT